MNITDTAAIKYTVKVPREHLDRCVFVLKLSADLRKLEHSGNRQEISKFVDDAYVYLKQVATASKEVKESSSSTLPPKLDWNQMKQEISEISHLVPDRDITTELGRAEAKDKSTSGNLASTIRKIKATATHFLDKTVDLLIAGEKWEQTRYESIKVHEKTPPAKLATLIAFSEAKPIAGTTFDFYSFDDTAPSKEPVQLDDDRPTPNKLFIVPSRGYYEFLSVLSFSKEEVTVIRNIFKLKDANIIYLKHSSGQLLRKSMEKAVIRDEQVTCSLISSRPRCKQLTSWGEVGREISSRPDSKWKVEPTAKVTGTQLATREDSIAASTTVTIAGSNSTITIPNKSDIPSHNRVNRNPPAANAPFTTANATTVVTNTPTTTTSTNNPTLEPANMARNAESITSNDTATAPPNTTSIAAGGTTNSVPETMKKKGYTEDTVTATILPQIDHPLSGPSRPPPNIPPTSQSVPQQQVHRQSRIMTPGPSKVAKEPEKPQGFMGWVKKKLGF